MDEPPKKVSTPLRAISLAIAVVLIIGGVGGLSGDHTLAKIGGAVAILVGLGFLAVAAGQRRRPL